MQFCIGFNNIPDNIKKAIGSANIFFTAEYEKNVKLRKQEMYYVWSDSYILPVRVKKSFFLKAAVLESEPFNYCDDENEKQFLVDAMYEWKRHGIQWTVCATTARFQNFPEGAAVVPSGNHIVDLTLPEEELWNNVHSKHRNSIRRGEKADIDIRTGGIELLEEYVSMSTETYLRSSQNDAGYDYYKGIMEGLENNIILFIAYKDKVPQSGGMFYYNGRIAYYLHGASVSRPEPGATNYLMWNAMIHFKKKGVKEFSFVGYHVDPEPGSKLEGIQRFKERFGGVLEPCYNFKFIQNHAAYRLYCIAMQVKNRKPFEKYQDAVDLQVEKYPELNGGKT